MRVTLAGLAAAAAAACAGVDGVRGEEVVKGDTARPLSEAGLDSAGFAPAAAAAAAAGDAVMDEETGVEEDESAPADADRTTGGSADLSGDRLVLTPTLVVTLNTVVVVGSGGLANARAGVGKSNLRMAGCT